MRLGRQPSKGTRFSMLGCLAILTNRNQFYLNNAILDFKITEFFVIDDSIVTSR